MTQVKTESGQTQPETDPVPDPAHDTVPDAGFDAGGLRAVVDWDMPFGRFKGTALIDLPEEYLFWFRDRGWPNGRLGFLMALALQLKVDGTDGLLKAYRKTEAGRKQT